MSEITRPRVLIADDHALVAEAFKRFLTAEFDVVAIVHDGHTLIQAAEKLRPDVILTDICMPLLNGLHAAERIKRDHPEVHLIYVTVNDDLGVIADAFQRGASGYLLKTSAASELVRAIHCVLQGKRYLSPSIPAVPELLAPFGEATLSCNKLTDRQVEVLQLLAEGRSMKEAAAVLNLTTRTVAFHKYRIMGCLSLNNDAEVVQYAMREHLVFL